MAAKSKAHAHLPAATLDADLAALVKRRDGLDKRRVAANSALVAAVAARRLLLVESDDPAPADLAKADRACRDAADSEEAATDTLREIDNRISALEQRMDRLRVNESRLREAADLEARAETVDAIMDRVAGLASEIDKERQALADAIGPRALGCYDPPSRFDIGSAVYLTATRYSEQMVALVDPLPVETIAARLVGHVLVPVLPTLGIADAASAATPHNQNTVTPVLGPIEDAVASKVLITDRMRELAAEVRRGTDRPEPTAKDITIGERKIFVTERCFYTTNGRKEFPVWLSAWFQTVPVPVADRLLELGLCHGAKSLEAARLVDAKKAHDIRPGRSNIIDAAAEPQTRENSRDLGFDLAEWHAAELERRRAVWRAGLPS